MIKIIKPGTRKTIECEQCGTLLSYEAEDVKTETSSSVFGHPNELKISKFIVCPQCTERIYILSTR